MYWVTGWVLTFYKKQLLKEQVKLVCLSTVLKCFQVPIHLHCQTLASPTAHLNMCCHGDEKHDTLVSL